MTRDIDLDAIRARLMNAIDGPWAIWPDLRPDGLITIGDATGVIPEGETWTEGPSNTIAHVYTEEDADFILHAPADVSALLSALTATRAELERLRKQNTSVFVDSCHVSMDADATRAEADKLRAERDEAWAWLPYEMRCTLTAKWAEQAAPAAAPQPDEPEWVRAAIAEGLIDPNCRTCGKPQPCGIKTLHPIVAAGAGDGEQDTATACLVLVEFGPEPGHSRCCGLPLPCRTHDITPGGEQA